MSPKIRRLLLRLPKTMHQFSSTAYRQLRLQVGLKCEPHIYYIVPEANWSVDWDGRYITRGIQQSFRQPAHITFVPRWLSGHILHYGSLGAYINNLQASLNEDNTVVVTIFHGNRSSHYQGLKDSFDQLIASADKIARIVTSCQIMQNRLVEWGISPNKIICIPLGVDLQRFQPVSGQIKLELRKKLNIPTDSVCIGSFQKDGEGWGKGVQPKLLKGPDVFLETIQKLKDRYQLFVLLTGPARGYVKAGLDKLGVPYRHEILGNYFDIVDYYRCLDLYLVTSRDEGGPKAILESMAAGVPIVSTKVGMAPDIIRHGWNGFLADVESADQLADCSTQIIENGAGASDMITNAFTDVQQYDWGLIAQKYYHHVYKPLIYLDSA